MMPQTTIHLLILAVLVKISAPGTTQSDEPLPLLEQAAAEYRNQEFQRAAELASKAIDLDPKSAKAYRLRATAHEALGQYSKAVLDWGQLIQLDPQDAGAFQARGEAHFCAGNIAASIADFDRYLAFYPSREPQHWQRGISYYYAGQYEKGVRQFEIHQTVNSQDVENAIWHYLCQAKAESIAAARKSLIEIHSDRRPWAMAVYRMFRGERTPDQVLAHASEVSRTEAERNYNLFYAHLYIGLFYEAAGHDDESQKHIRIAVEKYPSSHYMGDVARVHWKLRTAAASAGTDSPLTLPAPR